MNPTVLTLCFLGFAIVMFVLEKIPLARTATILSVGLCVTGVISPSDAFKGYVNSNVILCVGMFVVGQALFETGMANKIGGLVTRFAKSERQLIIAIMVIVGVMSGFLSNTGTAAVLIPVVCGIADESGFSRSRLLMPLVFAAALGGNLSIIGAPGNLMGVNALQELGLPTSFFLYAPVGIPMLVAGILYFALFGYRLLPDAREYHLHTLRHYFASYLLENNISKQVTADMLGHADTAFLEQTYCHPQYDYKAQAAHLLNDLIVPVDRELSPETDVTA